jgi:hypothetical protein
MLTDTELEMLTNIEETLHQARNGLVEQDKFVEVLLRERELYLTLILFMCKPLDERPCDMSKEAILDEWVRRVEYVAEVLAKLERG